MLKAKRANVILRISDNQADYYVAKGYTVSDLDGKIIKEPAGNNVESLKKQNDELLKKVAELEKEIAKLKEVEKVEEPIVMEKQESEEVVEKPKRKPRNN